MRSPSCCLEAQVGLPCIYRIKNLTAELLHVPLTTEQVQFHKAAGICLQYVGTRNEVNQEFEAQGQQGQYENIFVLENLRAPNVDTMRLASGLERGTGVWALGCE